MKGTLFKSRSKIYWTEQGADDSGVVSGGMDGRGMRNLRRSYSMHPTSIAVGLNVGPFWVDAARQRIEHMSGDNHWVFDSARHNKHYPPLQLALHHGNLYWVGGGSLEGRIFRVNLLIDGRPYKLDYDNEEYDVQEYAGGSNFTDKITTGMCVYDAKREDGRKNPCATNNSCPTGHVCLLSGQDSHRCVCRSRLQPAESRCVGLFQTCIF